MSPAPGCQLTGCWLAYGTFAVGQASDPRSRGAARSRWADGLSRSWFSGLPVAPRAPGSPGPTRPRPRQPLILRRGTPAARGPPRRPSAGSARRSLTRTSAAGNLTASAIAGRTPETAPSEPRRDPLHAAEQHGVRRAEGHRVRRIGRLAAVRASARPPRQLLPGRARAGREDELVS